MHPATAMPAGPISKAETLERPPHPRTAVSGSSGAAGDERSHAVKPSWKQRWPWPPLALALALLAFIALPRVNHNPRLIWTFACVSGALMIWSLLLAMIARKRDRLFAIEYVPVKSHWVQACVQFSIMLFWGWAWRNVFHEMPLIISQAVFLYALDALLTWSRGRTWRLGYGPLPIVVSTNLLLWFRDDWFYYQFLMLTTGALAKQFVTWEREGRRMHIFNPSAFGQFVFAVVLIATATTQELTWGREIAQFFDVRHMLVVIFLGGLVVQYLFHVTLMTAAACATLIALDIVYHQATGAYFFVNTNLAAPIFLGLHLLITDPATSPRTNLGRVVFGVLYASGYAALFRLLDIWEVPLFWDKLLPVPILNLCVPMIDRVMRSGWIGRFNSAWETSLPPKRLNLVHMACWATLFVTLWATGFIDGPHPGNSIPFWKQALADGKPHAGHSLVLAAGAQAEGGGSGAAYNELGLICMEGKVPGVNQSNAAAAKYFAKASELDDESGSVNVVIQFLFLRQWRSEEDVARALDRLEADCMAGGNGRSCFLVGFAYETGRGRPLDRERAVGFYERAGHDNLYAIKGLARLNLSGLEPPYDTTVLIPSLLWAAERGDAEAFWYLAYMYRDGLGLKQSHEKARSLLEKACMLGMEKACEALKQPQLPQFENPRMTVPGWATAFPMPTTAAAPAPMPK